MTTAELPDSARVVVIGGGVGGTSVAYHLAEMGEPDVVLVERAEALRSGRVDPREDNMLLVTTDGRKAALDLRLHQSELPDHPTSKVNLAVSEVERIWRETRVVRILDGTSEMMRRNVARGLFREADRRNAPT